MKEPSIPISTYRLQFNRYFTFRDATQLVEYLARLGVSHCYASPYLRSRPGSMHGYDIIDHNHLDPEIGTPEDYEAFVSALHHKEMGQILDIVPNHMGVMGSDNAWWLDVLENGEASNYAEFFDIDWEPLKGELQGKVLVPVLGDQYGAVLDQGELKLSFDREKGEFSIFYHQHRFPVNPKEYPRILGHDLERLEHRFDAQNQDFLELQNLIASFHHLPSRGDLAPDQRAERIRDKEINKRRLAELCTRSPEITAFINENVRQINGSPGDPGSFEDLHDLIKAQAYRLAYWRVAADDINYRRFFDVNDLAGLRQENEAVFEQTHRYILGLLREGKLDGLRVDHPDGLYDPAQYFHRLQCGQECRSNDAGCESQRTYIVIEKILTGNERLPQKWPVFGTTGYDFMNLVNGLFVDSRSERIMERIYRGFIGQRIDFRELVYDCKKLVMDRALASELNVLASTLTRIALSNRHTCDFTLKGLRDALSEVVACFPVYRTYVSGNHVSDTDRKYIEQAVECAENKSTSADASVYDFIREVLLTRQAEGGRDWYRRAIVRFAMKFQQFTSALMAKGVEDTAFYRYNRLTSLNEVGGDPARFGVAPEEFHREMEERVMAWPHSLSATSTHDSKRSEDIRARINVLSEIPLVWRRHVRLWRELNRAKKRHMDSSEAPTPNDEYLLYQTLIGAWPISDEATGAGTRFCGRICQYMLKAVREAKEQTSWANQNENYESALTEFVKSVLESATHDPFLADFVPFQRQISRLGMWNSLSQTLLKLTAPGVPDLYQGNELWEFSLVDPDNRRHVDYGRRIGLLDELQHGEDECSDQTTAGARKLLENMNDGRIKLYLNWKTLSLRRRHQALFQEGEYVPLSVHGAKADHVFAFARRIGSEIVIIAVPRLCARLLPHWQALPLGSDIWQDTAIEVPFNLDSSRNVFTGERIEIESAQGRSQLPLFRMLANFPVALLVGEG